MTEVKGAARLNATLRAAGRDLDKMDAAAGRAGELVRADAQKRAPRRTGRLGNSITSQAQSGNVRVISNAPYSAYVEYGTRRTRAQPFMQPALAAQTGAVVDAYGNETQQIMNRVRGA